MSYQPVGYPQPAPYRPAGATIIGEPDNQAHTVVAWIVCVLSLFFMLPWAIAATRHTKNAPVIAVVNLLTFWTIIGWFACLIWACVDQHKNAHLQVPVLVAPVMIAPQPYMAPQPYAQAQPYPEPTFTDVRPPAPYAQYPQPGAHAALPPYAQPSADPYAETVDATVLRPNYR